MVETVDTPVVDDKPRPVENVEQPVPAPRTELAKVDLPVVADITPEQDDSVEPRDNTGMPRRSPFSAPPARKRSASPSLS